MYRSPSPLSEQSRSAISATLNERLADGLDLHSQIKVAHWNIKGPQFAALHPLFETFAVSLANHNDCHRRARGDAGRQGLRHHPPRGEDEPPAGLPAGDVAATWSTCGCWPSASSPTWTACARRRKVAERAPGHGHVDLFTGIITEFEKHAWFLRASLES